jgi:3-hydroxyacyl-[acyl-carrier-protein] dehydratase
MSSAWPFVAPSLNRCVASPVFAFHRPGRYKTQQKTMKFNLIDRVELLTETRIVAAKQVSLAEEYLADHFPTFPVLPGVMMVEALTQAATWLLHHRRHFACSIAVLKEARNVKYGRFVAPGDVLRVDVEYLKDTTAGAQFKATGLVGDTTAIAARIELAYFNLADKQPGSESIDQQLKTHNQARWDVLKLTMGKFVTRL